MQAALRLVFAVAARGLLIQIKAGMPILRFVAARTLSLEVVMSIPVKALAATAVLLMAASAEAQLLPTWETHITLTQQDLDMIHSTVTRRVHGKPVGTAASWSNPASGNSGSIRLLKKFSRQQQQCEEIAYTARSKGPPVYSEHYHFNSCLQPDGTWKIASR